MSRYIGGMRPVRVELTAGPVDVLCQVVHDDGTVDTVDLKSANLRGAMREATTRLADVGYSARSRWTESDGRWCRPFKVDDIEDARASYRKTRRQVEKAYYAYRCVDLDLITPDQRDHVAAAIDAYEEMERDEWAALQRYVERSAALTED